MKKIQSIIHPTDLSAASESAFAHALSLAVLTRAELKILHVAEGEPTDPEWLQFPSVRTTLERWGRLEAGSARSQVFERLGIEVSKYNLWQRDPVDAIVQFEKTHTCDLIVLSTEGRTGLPRWLTPSTAEPLARRSAAMTLFVQKADAGFVLSDTGAITLNRILLPVDKDPDPQVAIRSAVGFIAALSAQTPVDIDVLHIGDSSSMPQLSLPEGPGWRWRVHQQRGDVVDTIVNTAKVMPAELIVMATAGHQDFLDVLRGSITERVLRRTHCPLLAVPAS